MNQIQLWSSPGVAAAGVQSLAPGAPARTRCPLESPTLGASTHGTVESTGKGQEAKLANITNRGRHRRKRADTLLYPREAGTPPGDAQLQGWEGGVSLRGKQSSYRRKSKVFETVWNSQRSCKTSHFASPRAKFYEIGIRYLRI